MSSSEEEIASPSQAPVPKPKAQKAKSKNNVANMSADEKAQWRNFEKKDPREHILDCPDMYVGSIVEETDTVWVYDHEAKVLEKRNISFVPGLYKIFDEILVNAADNKQRDSSMTEIKIVIDKERNKISVWNNGNGIPIEMHKVENMMVPTLIFGHLLTSSNYNKKEDKVTGGRNGYGAKLTNVYSTKFVVETASKKTKETFTQVWEKNMSKVGKAEIKKNNPSSDYTKIEFYPDLEKFGMQELTKDTIDLMSRRALDLAGTVRGVTVRLNGDRIDVKNFEDYCKMYIKDKVDDMGKSLELVSEKIPKGVSFSITGARWEVSLARSSGRELRQCSFVNGIATKRGGKHVEHVVNQIVDVLKEVVTKKNKTGHAITPLTIKQHLWVFVNCLIVNPSFDSQLKDNMNLAEKSFGSKFVLSDDFRKKLLKMGIVEAILAQASEKAIKKVDKMGGVKTCKIKGIPKLEDANDAGTRHSADCTLILTEGDSAKALVVSGFSVVGRDKYGVFPLRGKLLNVREASAKQLTDNAEIQNIVKILGLKFSCKYTDEKDMKTLRYGRLMIMTDQDQDGSHIKGLLINFIHHQWPGLLHKRFLEQFITPIVKATKGDTEHSFYSLPEFEEWKASTADWHKYRVKYFKGLGTSTAKEAKEYFQNMARHQIEFKWRNEQDDKSIELAFDKGHADARKKWLTDGMKERVDRRERGEPEMFLYEKNTKQVTYSDFVNKELILFSNADNERSIPSMVDGLKPGQRKILYVCMKRNDKREVKVAQLAGAVAEHAAYHHGEVSLQSTIVGLAQDYVGSNNINLLMPCGQFGTRLQGGKDSASARYIFTMLSPLARAIFSPLDAPLLNYLQDDNQKIEPDWYIPIVPMVLINGSEGIGTGWMTKIPNYNPRDIVDNLRLLMDDQQPKPMKPWWKGYRGHVTELDGGSKYVTMGEVAILEEENQIEITELPIRTWTQNYKESVIEPMLLGSEKAGKAKPPQIQDYREYHTDSTVRFVVTLGAEKFKAFDKEGWHKAFKLHSTFSMSSMVLFDAKGVIRKYDTVGQILTEFYALRLKYYEKRKTYWLAALGAEAKKLENQARFIQEKIEGKIKIEDVKRSAIVKLLVERKYDSDPVKAWKKSLGSAAFVDEEEPASNDAADEAVAAAVEAAADTGPDFDYLMSMTFWKVSNEQKLKLLEERNKKKAEVEDLRKKTPKDLWQADLDVFLEKLDDAVAADKQASGTPGKAAVKSAKGAKAAGGRGKKAAVPNKADTFPAPTGQRVEPIVDQSLIERHEKAKDLKERKAKGEVGQKGRKAKVAVDEDGNPLPAAEKKKRTPKKEKEANGDTDDKPKLKQSTLDSKLTKKKKKKGSSSEEDESDDFDSEDLSDDSEDDQVDDGGSDEYDFDKSNDTKKPVTKNRVAAAVVKASVPVGDDDDDDVMEVEVIEKPQVTKSKSAVVEPNRAVTKSNGEAKKSGAAGSSKAVADTPTKNVRLISSSEDDDDKPAVKSKKVAPPTKKPLVVKKPTVTTISSDEEDFKPAAKKAAPAKKHVVKRKNSSSGSSDDGSAAGPSGMSNGASKKAKNALDDSDEEIPPPRARPARAAGTAAMAASRKVFSDSSIENEEDEHLTTID